ncbi:unnamed protein product, partial [Symbiodinium sp. CCMP2456]
SGGSALRMAASRFIRYGSTGEIEDVLEFQIARAIIAGDMQVISWRSGTSDPTPVAQTTIVWIALAEALGRHANPVAGDRTSESVNGEGLGCFAFRRNQKCRHRGEATRGKCGAGCECSGEGSKNLHISEAAMLRLLDLAILTGDADLAQRCAHRCGGRKPLRRWRSDDLFDDRPGMEPLELEPDVMAAALLSGIALQGLNIGIDVPLREAIVLSGDLQLWNRLAHVLPQGRSQWIPKGPNSGKTLRKFDARHMPLPQLCMDRLNLFLAANMPLAEFRFIVFLCQSCEQKASRDGQHYHAGPWSLRPVRLLDVAVYQGQSACAELLASAGATCATVWTRNAYLPNIGPWLCAECENVARIDSSVAVVPLEERHATAGAALRVAFARAERLVAPTGLGVYQLLLMWGRCKKVPAALVNLGLSFAAERPQLASVLEGLEEEVLQAASAAQREDEGPVDRLAAPLLQQNQQPQGEVSTRADAPAGEADPADFDQEMGGRDTKTDDLLVAIRNSRADPPPLSPDGVICFRLTRKANAPHVNELLFDAEGPLQELHDRVRDAECEVAPDWSPFKALFVPLTEMQLLELTRESSADTLDFGKEHILALQSDEPLLDRAIRGLSNKYRPRLWPAIPRDAHGEPDEEREEDEAAIEVETNLRTNSSLGFPSYEQ